MFIMSPGTNLKFLAPLEVTFVRVELCAQKFDPTAEKFDFV